MSPGVIGARRIVPVDKTSYVDGLQLWLKDPLPRIQLEWLATQCDSIDVRQQLKRWVNLGWPHNSESTTATGPTLFIEYSDIAQL